MVMSKVSPSAGSQGLGPCNTSAVEDEKERQKVDDAVAMRRVSSQVPRRRGGLVLATPGGGVVPLSEWQMVSLGVAILVPTILVALLAIVDVKSLSPEALAPKGQASLSAMRC